MILEIQEKKIYNFLKIISVIKVLKLNNGKWQFIKIILIKIKLEK